MEFLDIFQNRIRISNAFKSNFLIWIFPRSSNLQQQQQKVKWTGDGILFCVKYLLLLCFLIEISNNVPLIQIDKTKLIIYFK